MAIKNVALINANDQVVNIVVVDVEDEVTIAALHEYWGTVRWAEFDQDADNIILDLSPDIWTTHTEETGFVLPPAPVIEVPQEVPAATVVVGGKTLPVTSLLFVENADKRPDGWTLEEGQTELSLADAE
jgi:hypothetical protein